ncbi:MAG: hypothetical protein M3O34_17695 [Chloroflexota bacterium]|nr:hypothetical protein [Chloroflexota bacterium]
MNVRGRLVGLGLIGIGLASAGIVYGLWLLDQAYGPRPPAPPGLPAGMSPLLSPIACLVPVGAIGATLLVLEGLRRVIFPE